MLVFVVLFLITVLLWEKETAHLQGDTTGLLSQEVHSTDQLLSHHQAFSRNAKLCYAIGLALFLAQALLEVFLVTEQQSLVYLQQPINVLVEAPSDLCLLDPSQHPKLHVGLRQPGGVELNLASLQPCEGGQVEQSRRETR